MFRRSVDEDREAGDEEEHVPESKMSLNELRTQWMEASYMLRANMTDEEVFEKARKTVEESLRFLDKLGRVAEQHGEALNGGTGAIFQELIKDLAHCGVSGMMIDNARVEQEECLSFNDAAQQSEMAKELGIADEWPEFLHLANEVRCVVRIKLQDANDLKAAQYALESCSTCFNELAAQAKERGISRYEMMRIVEEDDDVDAA